MHPVRRELRPILEGQKSTAASRTKATHEYIPTGAGHSVLTAERSREGRNKLEGTIINPVKWVGFWLKVQSRREHGRNTAQAILSAEYSVCLPGDLHLVCRGRGHKQDRSRQDTENHSHKLSSLVTS